MAENEKTPLSERVAGMFALCGVLKGEVEGKHQQAVKAANRGVSGRHRAEEESRPYSLSVYRDKSSRYMDLVRVYHMHWVVNLLHQSEA